METNFNPAIYKESIAQIKQLLRNRESSSPSSEVLSELNSINQAHTEFVEEYVNSMESDVNTWELVEALDSASLAIVKLINNEIESIKNTPHQKIIDLLVHAINNGGYEVHKNYRNVIIQATENATPEQLEYLNKNTGVDTVSGVSFLIRFVVGEMSLHIFTEDGLNKSNKFGGEFRSAMVIKRICDFEELYKDTEIKVNTVFIGYDDMYRTAISPNGSSWDTHNFMTNGGEVIPAMPLNQENTGIFNILKLMDEANRLNHLTQL